MKCYSGRGFRSPFSDVSRTRCVATYSGGYRLYETSYYTLTKICSCCGCEFYCVRGGGECPVCGRYAGRPATQPKKSGKASSYDPKLQFPEFEPLLPGYLIGQPELIIKV